MPEVKVDLWEKSHNWLIFLFMEFVEEWLDVLIIHALEIEYHG